MAHLGVHVSGAPWPFKDMQVGDVVICTAPADPNDRRRADATAHAYAAAAKKKFVTKQLRNKATGEVGFKITRMPDDYVRPRKERPVSPQKAAGMVSRDQRLWPIEKLAPGQSWATRDPELMSKAIAAAGNLNRRATQEWRKGLPEAERMLVRRKLYSVRQETCKDTLAVTAVVITRNTDEVMRLQRVPVGRAPVERRTIRTQAVDAARDAVSAAMPLEPLDLGDMQFAPIDERLRARVIQIQREVQARSRRA